MHRFWDTLARNKVALLLTGIIALQILTWRAVLKVEEHTDDIRFSVTRKSPCGEKYAPCHVVVDP
ncbi:MULTISPECIES: hypothetical protein [unclassified Bradyrhizobium]|uniref:hypothetical protein n=1 Tax=unclassified Bradyrhizobium TaxID=2631580 RepID=UPI001FF893AB|nr:MULTISPECIES: hypothetical protein [unclassified Bradyrhizobium]MCK1316934.1 hypothetical protein [Bradyrhizobium sp. 23]MCK1333900.1 hypothetical protein [Bradyrhizobium sp. CW9]MCK1566039.1 hypothetical protein [Bradyrhizobium sp. 173]MCK1629544.1 hypothetical protein [Bradyrhizobium sp. 162]UPJ99494.1 hypothetical protein IVB07_19420 [Bradyrhizobium sp. 172]